MSERFIRTRGAGESFGQLDDSLGETIIAEVRASILSDIIIRNSDIDVMQDYPFLAETRTLTDTDAPDGTWGDDTFDVISQRITGLINSHAGNDIINIRDGSIVDGVVKTGRGDDDLNMSSGNVKTNAMRVSPQHRMLLSDWRCKLICGTGEVLVAAKHLINDLSIRPQTGGTIDYIHILFDDHQIVMAEGIASERFHPGRVRMGAMPDAARCEILDLLPELAVDLDGFGPAARYTAKSGEAALINNV